MTRACLVALFVSLVAWDAGAQDQAPALRAHRVSVSAGLTWLGSYGIGDNTATLRRNEPSTLTPSPFTLFTADASLARAAGFEARVAYALTRAVAVEFGGAYAQPRFTVDIANDQEASAIVLSDEHVSQYTVDGSVLWQLSAVKLGARARPYITGGAGYLRQLYENRAKLETGAVVNIGGGVRYWLRGGDRAHRALGIRGEALLRVRHGGIDIAGDTRAFPVLNVFGFFGF